MIFFLFSFILFFSILNFLHTEVIFFTEIVGEILKLQQLVEKVTECDPSLWWGVLRETETVTLPYIEIHKGKICSAKHSHITNFFSQQLANKLCTLCS